jgi:hypothetical protein
MFVYVYPVFALFYAWIAGFERDDLPVQGVLSAGYKQTNSVAFSPQANYTG